MVSVVQTVNSDNRTTLVDGIEIVLTIAGQSYRILRQWGNLHELTLREEGQALEHGRYRNVRISDVSSFERISFRCSMTCKRS